ncbi:HNH endonuclease signature motif containing protein [Streptomyces sp. NPDC053741]|uniref:HNH endonuclease signature motif containing protein n=1 Tax=Streptomyces TaxID=1883 RepID=UPI003425F50C
MAKRVDAVVFNGIKFRRYPDAPGLSDRRYYVPGIADRQQGIRRLHEEIWKAAHGRDIPEGHHVHHADGNHLNNDPGNLVCISADEHREHHAEERRGVVRLDQLEHLDAIRPLAAEWHGSEEGRAWHREHGARTWEGREEQPRTCEQCGEGYGTIASHGNERFCSNKCKSAWRRAAGFDNEPRTCEQCGEVWTVNRYSRARFCGRACSARNRWDREKSRLEPDGR